MFAKVVEGLTKLCCPKHARVAVDKLFGRYAASARALDGILHRCFGE